MLRFLILLALPCLCAAKVVIGPSDPTAGPPQTVKIERVTASGAVVVITSDGTRKTFTLHGIAAPRAGTKEAKSFEAIANHLASGRVATLVPHRAVKGGVVSAQFILQSGSDLGLMLLRGGVAKAAPSPSLPDEYLAAARRLSEGAVEDMAATSNP